MTSMIKRHLDTYIELLSVTCASLRWSMEAEKGPEALNHELFNATTLSDSLSKAGYLLQLT